MKFILLRALHNIFKLTIDVTGLYAMAVSKILEFLETKLRSTP